MDNLEKDKQALLKVKYGGVTGPEFDVDVRRLQSGEHIDYVIGWSDFLHCKIWLDEGPLIPRVETEYWVERAIGDIASPSSAHLSILDIFAGSGCIGVALLKHLPHATVTFSDIDERFSRTIAKNVEENVSNAKRATFIHSDCFENISDTFDFIFANPPYIDETKGHTDVSVRVNDPALALFAPENGNYYVRSLLEKGPEHLNEGGTLYIEFDSTEIQAVRALVEKHRSKYSSVSILEDQYARPRVIKAIH